MKISPIPSTVSVPTEQQAPLSVRSIRMNTRATPGVLSSEPAPPPEDPTAPLTIPPNSDAGAEEATQPLSPQLAALAKQRRALQVKERALAEREKALESKATQVSGIDPAQLKSAPLRVLLDNGVTYDQLTKAILDDQEGTGPEVQALKAQIEALKGDFEKKLTDRDQQAEQNALAEMRREATKLASEGDTFELVRETGSIPQVMELIEKTYRESGEVMEVREALQLVEDELISESLKLAKLNKVQGKLQPEPFPAPQPPQLRPPMRTLTNRDTAAVPLSRRDRALLAFAGQLKK